MAVRRILKYPDPFLRKPTEKIVIEDLYSEDFGGTMQICLEGMWQDMEETLMESDHGAALAANQIGLKYYMFAVNQQMSGDTRNIDKVRAIPPIIINPTIISHGSEKETNEEGCLSFPGVLLKVSRWKEVEVSYSTVLHWGGPQKRELLSVTETYSGFWGRVFQHEIDHLEGKLFVDQLSTKKRLEIVEFIKKRGR